MNKQELQIPIEVSNILKLIACIIICIHHYSQYGIDSAHLSSPIYEVFRRVGGDLSVTLFFFLSGYGLMVSHSKNKFEFRKFISKRFWRVLEPFWLVNLIAVCSYWILGVDNVATHSPMHAIGSVIGIVKFDLTMWFIHYLLALYILFAIGLLIKRPLIFVSTTVLAVVLLFSLYGQPSYSWSSLFAFPLGMMVGEKPDSSLKLFRKYNTLLLFLGVYFFILYFFVFQKLETNGALWHQMNNILLMAVLLFVLGRFPIQHLAIIKIPSKWQPYYEVYLIHPKILFISLFSFELFMPLWSFLAITILSSLLIHNIPSLSNFNLLSCINFNFKKRSKSIK